MRWRCTRALRRPSAYVGLLRHGSAEVQRAIALSAFVCVFPSLPVRRCPSAPSAEPAACPASSRSLVLRPWPLPYPMTISRQSSSAQAPKNSAMGMTATSTRVEIQGRLRLASQ
jgi:hypothetical protein